MKVLAIRHIPREGAGTIENFLRSQGAEIEYWDIPQSPQRRINIEDYAACISLGGPMGVYEEKEHPFIRRELALLEQIIGSKKPLLGICLGSQLLAKALGARVFKGPKKEIGWYPVTLDPAGRQDPAFENAALAAGQNGENFLTFQWHGDTFDLPQGAVRLAHSALYPNQAFRYDNHVYALQFHLEMTGDMIREWIAAGSEELSQVRNYIDPSAILSGNSTGIPTLNESCRRFCQSFFKEHQLT